MFKKIIITLLVLIWSMFPFTSFATKASPIVDWLTPDKNEKIVWVSYDSLVEEDKDFQWDLKNIWFWYLWIAKWVLQGIMLIYLVYAGFMFFYWSIWKEDKLESAKNQIYYSLAWLLFINVPWVLYSLFWDSWWKQADAWVNSEWFNAWIESSWNLLVSWNFQLFVENNLLWLLEVVVWIVATFSIILSAYNIINADWKDDIVTEEKDKIVYSVTALIFVWFMQFFKDAVFTGQQDKIQDLFSSVMNLAIFIWWPIALSFIILAWYYLITSNWDEERLEKAKNIVINSIIWVLILMASWTFLADINF